MRPVLLLLLLLLACPLILSGVAHGQGDFEMEVSWEGSFYPGGAITAKCNFTNTGDVPLKILSLTLVSDFGSFSSAPSQPFIVEVASSREFDGTFHVPSSAAQGKHSSSLSADFQYWDPGAQGWFTPSSSPVALHPNITLGQDPTFSNLLYIVGGILSLVLVIAALFRRRLAGGLFVPSAKTR